MLQAIIYDLDGMLFKEPHFFTKEMEMLYDIPTQDSLFNDDPNYKRCKIGEITLREFLQPYFEKWEKYPKFKASYEEFTKTWFNFTKPIYEVHNIARALKDAGIVNIILTDNVKERIEYINNKYNLSEIFEIVGSFNFGVMKTDPEFIKKFTEKFNLSSKEILVFDDKEKNIKRLKSQGFNAKIYKGIDDFKKLLVEYNINYSL